MCNADNLFTLSHKRRVQLNKELNVTGVVDRAITQIYDDRKVDKGTQQDLFKTLYQPLKEAVNEGFTGKIEYGTPNYEMLKNLQTNTAVFSIFKSHALVKEIAGLLKDSSGNLRTKEDFKREALKVDNTYRVQHLETEYDTAVRASRMASVWMDAQKSKRLYPNAKYVRSKAAKPSEDHLQYVGIIRPLDDPFWSAHWPPNRYRCQCSAEVTDEDPTDIPANLPPPQKGFEFNSGKTGEVFDLKNSSYIKSVPPKEQPALIKEATKTVNIEAAKAAPYQTLYENKKTGATVSAHPLAFDNGDFNTVLKNARDLANWKQGPNKIEILPDVKDPALRAALLPGVKGNSNPDYKLDGVFADLKEISASGKRTVAAAIDSARQQGDSAVLVVKEESKLTEEEAISQVVSKAAYPEMKDFGDVWVNYKGKWSKNIHKKNKPE